MASHSNGGESPSSPTSTPGWLTQFVDRVWKPAAVIASGLAAIFSFLAQQYADVAQKRAKATDEKATQLLSFRQEDRADLALDREYQLKVAELTLASIESSNAKKQMALLALAQSLPEPMSTRLVTALTGSEDDKVASGAQSALSATVDFDRVNAASPTGPVAQAAATSAPTMPTAQTTVLAPYTKIGWDFDVFWCQGTAMEPARYQRALKFSTALADASKGNRKIGGEALGRVRLRPLSPIVNARPGYGIYGDIVRAEPSETKFANAVAAFAGQSGTPLTVTASGTSTRTYLSFFFCR